MAGDEQRLLTLLTLFTCHSANKEILFFSKSGLLLAFGAVSQRGICQANEKRFIVPGTLPIYVFYLLEHSVTPYNVNRVPDPRSLDLIVNCRFFPHGL